MAEQILIYIELFLLVIILNVTFIAAPDGLKISADFKNLTPIGSGTIGRVCRAERKEMKEGESKFVAIKSIFLDSEPEASKRRLRKEANLTKNLDHKLIVKLIEFRENRDKGFFIMEYAGGGEMFDLVVSLEYNNGNNQNHKTPMRMGHSRAGFYIAELLRALNYLHEKNIVFRDLKPDNVKLTTTGHIKLVDFGYAKDIITDGPAQTIAGTRGYMPPQILEKAVGISDDNKSYDSKKADMWMLGIMVYTLIALNNPFNDEGGPAMVLSEIKANKYYIPLNNALFAGGADELLTCLLKVDESARCDLQKAQEIVERRFFVDKGVEDKATKKTDWNAFWKTVDNAELTPVPFVPKGDHYEYEDVSGKKAELKKWTGDLPKSFPNFD